MLLFAYASNMKVDKFAAKVPSAKKLGVARLPNYVFTFTLTADDQSAKANITPSSDALSEVWGVLIEYADHEKDNFYYPDGNLQLIQVNCIDQHGHMHKAEAFIAKPHAVNEFLLPYDWYLEKIVRIGREEGLPETYTHALSLLDSKVDPDEQRRARKTGK